MLAASLYILLCSARNRVRQRLARLREPRYLAGALLAAGFLAVLYFRPIGRRPRRRQLRVQAAAAFQASGSALVGIALFVAAAVSWVLPFDHGLLDFSKAEADFLLPAPVRRRQLLMHGLLRAQPGLLLGAALPALVLPLATTGARLRMALAIWLVLLTGKVYATGVVLSKARRARARTALGRIAWMPLALLVVAALAVLLPILIEFGERPAVNAQDALERTSRVVSSGLPALALLPFSALSRPMFAGSTSDLFDALGAASFVLAAVGTWVIVNREAIPDVAVVSSYEQPRPAALRGAGRPAWTLAIEGQPQGAIVWKAATGMRRSIDYHGAAWSLAVLALLVGAASLDGPWAEALSYLLRVFIGVVLWFLLFIAPQSLKADLRSDLRHVDLLKTWPVTPAAMVRSQLLWPVVVLTLAAWVTMAVALALSSRAYADVSWSLRLSVVATAAILTPVFIWAQYAIRNAAVLAFPSWMPAGSRQARGFDAIGHRALAAAVTWLVLAIVFAPGSLAGWIAWSLLGPSLESSIWPLAAAVCAVVVGLELILAARGLAVLYERLDPPAVAFDRGSTERRT